MFLRPNRRSKDGKDHTYWSLVETVRTPNGPRQKTLCYLGELNSSAQARWVRTVEVFNEQGEAQQLKLFPSHLEPPAVDPQVARVLLNKVRLERTRQFGACWLGLELWKRLELDRFFEATLDHEPADVPWSRVAALLAINRLCAPGSELALEQRWYPSTALDDLLGIEEGKVNDTRLYRCLDRILPHKTKLERHLKERYGELFGAEFDVLLYDLTSTYVEGAAEKNPMMRRGYSRDHRPDCEQMVIALIVNSEGFPFSYETFDGDRADEVLAAEEHLGGGVLEALLDFAEALPRVFLEEAEAGIESGTAPGFERPETHLIQLARNGQHIVDAQAGREQRLMSIAQYHVGYTQGFVRFAHDLPPFTSTM